VAELKRCKAKGAKAFLIPVFPISSYFDPMYEPLWAAAAEAGTPLCLHRNHGGKDPMTGDFAAQYKVPGLNVAGMVTRYFSAVIPLTEFIFTGTFERHPDLKIVQAEVNFGWVPYWVFQMDQCHGQQENWVRYPFKGKPSECVGKNVFVTVLDDEVGFAAVNAYPVMAEVGMFSIDYPHSVCLWPGALDHIERVTKGVDASLKAKIMHGTAERVFGLN
jgi:predicted TIM-barrel fold metal-dependent hydrolase